ncbi:MAG: M12 family metallo-peptidase, partial [Anaerolineae bacterium]|nr:M12 family metallo-peptidase [Anaerolineae bacterium]
MIHRTLTITIFLLVVFQSLCSAGQSTPSLFVTEDSFHSQVDGSERSNPIVLRHRLVQARPQILLSGASPSKTVRLPFFKDASFTAVNMNFMRHTGSSFTWTGNIPEARFSLVVLTVDSKSIEGHVNVNGRIFQITQLADGLHSVRELNQAEWHKIIDVAVEPEQHPAAGRRGSNNTSVSASTVSTIDVMIVYTSARGTSGNINSDIQNAIATANQIMSGSNVNAQLKLVYSGQIGLTESGSVSTDLNNAKNDSTVQSLRNQFGADLVSFWVKNSGGACGIADQVGPFNVVVQQGCFTNYAFSHEVGHSMGAHHEKYINPGSNPFPYSHGHVHLEFIDSVCNGGWYTMMAYGQECADKGVFCCQITFYSNPGLSYNGDPIGIANEADNHRAMNDTAPIVAGWKQPPACNVPTIPSLVSPADGATNVSTAPLLDWSASNNASSYKVDVATDSTFNSIVRTQTLSGTSWTVSPALSSNTLYWWRVRAANSCGNSAFSQQRTFRTQSAGCTLPSIPSLSSPTNGGTGVSTTPSLKWNTASNAASYRVEVATNSTFTNVVRSANTSGTSWTISPALTAAKYYWRVRGVNSCGNGAYSSIFNFTTLCGNVSELFKNPDFESGNVLWQNNSSSNINNGTKYPARSGSWKAQLNGRGSTSTRWISQALTLPSNACSVSFTFYLRVATAETTTTLRKDRLKVQVLTNTGAVLKTIATYSNLNKSTGYLKKSFSLTSYRGKNIKIRFYGTENFSKQTTFLIDTT